MKKLICFLCVLLLTGCFSGCGNDGSQNAVSSEAVVVYLKRAQQMIDQGDYDSALKILEEGYSATGDKLLEEMRNAVRASGEAISAAKEQEDSQTPPPEMSAVTPAPSAPPQTASPAPTLSASPTPSPVPSPAVNPEDIPEQVQEIQIMMDEAQQYEANIFLSNFAEQFFLSYRIDSATIAELVNFSYMYLCLNRAQDVSHDDYGFDVVSFDTVKETVIRFFAISITEADTRDYPNNDLTHYADGNFYFMNKFIIRPEDYTYFAVADELYQEPNGAYCMTYHIYSNDAGVQDVYHLTPAQAGNTKGISVKGEGTAIAVGYSYNGHSTYQLAACSTHLY